MKNIKLITIIATCLLLTSIFAVIPAFSTQPPIDTTTYYIGTIGQPSRMDPARAYDTASGELIQNVAQTLIWWDDKNVVSFTPGYGYNLTLADYADLDSYTPVLASALPIIVYNASGSYWTFTINTAATFQPWIAGNGSLIPPRNLKASDVIYSFQRQMVYDSYYAPTWMWYGSAFTGAASVGWSSDIGGPFDNYANGTFVNPADEVTAGAMIQSWCYPGPGPNDVSFHFQQLWAAGVLRQVFSQTWGSILEPEWVMEHGGWDGKFTAGWTNNYHWKPTVSRSEIDAWKDPATYGAVAGSKYPSGNKHINEIHGTGPYNFTLWDTATKVWRIDKFAAYWGGWAGNHVTTVISKGIDSWPTRKMLFLEGEFDVAAVPRANMFDLLTSMYNPIPGVNLAYNIAALSCDMMSFCMNLTGASPYQSYVGYPSHLTTAVPLFFANEHMRRAFAWALNYTQYIKDAYFGEAIQQASWWVDGLSPAWYKNTALVLRNLNLTEMQNELNLAVVDGFNVGDKGFETTLGYNIGNDQRMIAVQLVASAFQSLNVKYKVNVIGMDWPVFLDAMNNGYLPFYNVGWLADFADPHNFVQPYMQSTGLFPISQGPPFPADQDIIDDEINAAIVEANVTLRGEMYQDLQLRFYNDVISVPLVQPSGRRFVRDWVQGWYFNALYPGVYAYDLYKSVSLLENVDLDITGTITPIVYYPTVLVYHGEMRIGNGSTAGAKMKYDLKVTRADSNPNVALLYGALGLLRNNTGGAFQFVNATYFFLAPGATVTETLDWYEDGKSQVMTADNWTVSGVTSPLTSNALDINATNNQVLDGIVKAKILVGDIQGNGVVDIYDAILLSNAFNKKTGAIGFNVDADLKVDGVIDIYDAILLANNFNKRVP